MSFTGFNIDDVNFTSFSLTKGKTEEKNNIETFTTSPSLDTNKQQVSNYNTLQRQYVDATSLLIGQQIKHENNNTYNNIAMKPTLIDARNEDENKMMIQENYIYILGTLTLAIVLVGSIVIIKQ